MSAQFLSWVMQIATSSIGGKPIAFWGCSIWNDHFCHTFGVVSLMQSWPHLTNTRGEAMGSPTVFGVTTGVTTCDCPLTARQHC